MKRLALALATALVLAWFVCKPAEVVRGKVVMKQFHGDCRTGEGQHYLLVKVGPGKAAVIPVSPSLYRTVDYGQSFVGRPEKVVDYRTRGMVGDE